jgi:hypothetical protein
LSPVSQTPLVQTRAPAAVVHIPFSVGFECAPSVGTAPPLAIFAVHAWELSLHQLPLVQSASTLQPPGATHVPLVLHAPDRHTVAPLVAVQGPSPFA